MSPLTWGRELKHTQIEGKIGEYEVAPYVGA